MIRVLSNNIVELNGLDCYGEGQYILHAVAGPHPMCDKPDADPSASKKGVTFYDAADIRHEEAGTVAVIQDYSYRFFATDEEIIKFFTKFGFNISKRAEGDGHISPDYTEDEEDHGEQYVSLVRLNESEVRDRSLASEMYEAFRATVRTTRAGLPLGNWKDITDEYKRGWTAAAEAATK